MIESVNNKQIKSIIKLKTKKYQDLENKFLVEGEHLVEEAKKAGYLDLLITTDEKYTFEKVLLVNETVMKKISDLKSPPKVIGICKKIIPKEIFGKVVILENLQDPGNVGTIIRSANAFGIDTIILSSNTVSVYNPKVIRASEGSIFYKNIIIDNPLEKVKTLKKMGYTIYTTDVKDGTSLEEIKFNSKTAIIIGNEGSGVSNDLKELSDVKIHIPMSDSCESLNAAVSASIIFYKTCI